MAKQCEDTRAATSDGAALHRQFNVVIERHSEGYYVASVPALPGCHTQARSMEELMAHIRQAIELYLEVRGEPVDSFDFVGVRQVRLAP